MSDNLSSGVELVLNDHIATITLNLVECHNALNSQSIDAFLQHLDTVAANAEVRVLIITGAGNKTFCAGAELNDLGAGVFDGDRFTEVPNRIAALAIPVICAFNGSAYGGGTDIGLACDFRIGAPAMRLFVPPARIGICYPVAGIQRFVSTLGLAFAKRLLLAGEEFRGQALLDYGYLTHLVEAEEVLPTATALAERIAGYAPLSVQAMKQICNQVAAAQGDYTQAEQWVQQCAASEDLKEGLLARQEKRPPRFRGR